MKNVLMCLCLAAAGCGGTIPKDSMERWAHGVSALNEAYLAVCVNRDDAPECKKALDAVGKAADVYIKFNNALKD